jgi:hypothetical protein
MKKLLDLYKKKRKKLHQRQNIGEENTHIPRLFVFLLVPLQRESTCICLLLLMTLFIIDSRDIPVPKFEGIEDAQNDQSVTLR